MTVTFKSATTDDEKLRSFAIRSIVFVGEQACPFREEFDGLDAGCLHILGEEDGEPVAAGRIRPVDGWAKLERIAVLPRARGRGLGHTIVEFMLDSARASGFRRFKLHAQAHLVGFYTQHGFQARGERFQEAGIDHFAMVRESEVPAHAAEVPVSAGEAWRGAPVTMASFGALASPTTLSAGEAPTASTAAVQAVPALVYIGFWARLAAALLDTVLWTLIAWPILLGYYGLDYLDKRGLFLGWLDFVVTNVGPCVATVLFWRWKGATPGQMAVGARIIDARTGARPTTAQFIGRYLGFFLSALPLGLGFLWIAFDKRKQGWHDMLAQTVVVRGKNLPVGSAAEAPRRAPTPNEDWMPF
jgi:predicted GNAT family N-acyltransferase/uncharacterized RDD family membrane protein YckC